MDILDKVTKEQYRDDIPEFHPGDTIEVCFTIKDGDKKRKQIFKGIVIQKRGNGINKNFTVRKTSNGVAIERVFPIHSPLIDNIKVVRYGRVRRAKLFYLRSLTGKAAKVKEKKRY